MRARDLPPLKKLPASEWWGLDTVVMYYIRLKPDGPAKLADIAIHVFRKTKVKGVTQQEVYVWCGASTQRLKKQGRIRLVTGNGAGWVAV